MWRIVSSYSNSLAPGLRFSKHLSDSAKASSTVQPLLIMMPVQDFEFMTSFCQTWPNFNQVYSSCFCHSTESACRSPGMPLEERRTHGVNVPVGISRCYVSTLYAPKRSSLTPTWPPTLE